MEKISDIIESIANEKGLSYDDVKDRICIAFVNAAKRLYGPQCEYEATLDQLTKCIHLYQKILVVEDNDERLDEEHFISLKKAHEVDSSLEIGDSLNYELNIDGLGRTGAGVLSREIEYHIQRLIEEKIHEKYSSKINTLVFGTVTRVDSDENTYIEIDEIRAVMSMKNRIKDEKFRVGNTVKAIIKSVNLDKKDGIRVELSRTSPKFLEALLKAEVPEIKDGGVVIHNSARIPGKKAKVALYSNSPSIDPVGATVGIKGVRINAVSAELNGENIDAIEYSSEPTIFVARSLAPAIINSVKIEGNKAIVSLVAEQKSKAIGSSGINIRLASMLTGYEIELHEVGSAAKEINNEEGLKNLKALFGDM